MDIEIDESRVLIRIRDEGQGFKLEDVPDPLHPDNLLKPSGRGVKLYMTRFFDSVDYTKGGTEVTMIKKRSA